MKDQQTTEDTCPLCDSTEQERNCDSFNCPCLQPRSEGFYLKYPESINDQYSCTPEHPLYSEWFTNLYNSTLK